MKLIGRAFQISFGPTGGGRFVSRAKTGLRSNKRCLMKNDLQTIIVELERSQPSRDFHGRVAEAQFCVEDGHVLLYDARGARIAREPLPSHLTGREYAAVMLRRRERTRNSSFSRHIVYERNYY
jgi:hypothetical protein